MIKLKTVHRNDPDFYRYMDGSFSKTERAIPLRSLNINSDFEQVTFQICPVSEIKKPPFLIFWSQVFKANNFLMIAFPAVLILIKNSVDQTLLDPVTAIYSFFAVLSLMAAANLRNDWSDHLSGLDRIHPQSHSHSIQMGWVTGRQVYLWSFFYLGLGILLGLRAVLLYPEILFIVGILGLLGLVGLTSFKSGLKYRSWSEAIAFLLLGPFFTLGFQISMGNQFDLEAILIGAVTGWMSVYYLHLKNFQHLIVNDQAKFKNTVSRLGFEKSKKLLFLWWIALINLILIYQWVYTDMLWFLLFLLIGLGLGFLQYRALKGIPSPLSSRVQQAVMVGKSNLVVLTLLILLEATYFYWFFL